MSNSKRPASKPAQKPPASPPVAPPAPPQPRIDRLLIGTEQRSNDPQITRPQRPSIEKK